MRSRIALFATAAGLGAFWLAGLGQAATPPKLAGVAGPDFTIEVTKAGRDVKKLKRGTYTIVVRDKSASHNFHLVGPGVNKKTGVAFVGKKTWTVKLKAGKYTYKCDVHAAQGMKGSFKVV